MMYSAWVGKNSDNNADDFASLKLEWVQKSLPELSPGQVQIRVFWSGVNFKDALAFTGKGKILRRLPLTPGIDASGVVSASKSSSFKEGDEVVVTGCGIGENVDGGFGEYITVPQEWVIPRPSQLSLKDCALLGTAGFTAGLALWQLQKNDLTPAVGEVLVTGATGGVGSIALLLLKNKKYSSVAWTRKESQNDWLKKIGATKVENVSAIDWKTRPLESGTWAAAIDNVGGDVLNYILARIKPHGSVASIGLAKSPQLSTTVFPFILRGVNILGTSSATCPRPLREKIWNFLNETAAPWEDVLTQNLTPAQIPEYTQKMMNGQTHGRALVKMN